MEKQDIDREVQPITKEMLDSLSHEESKRAKKNYSIWRDKQRERDRTSLSVLKMKIWRFQNKERFRAYLKKCRENPKNRERIRLAWKKHASKPEVRERRRKYMIEYRKKHKDRFF